MRSQRCIPAALLIMSVYMSVYLSAAHAQEDLRLIDAFPNLRFSAPIFITSSKDGTDRIFVVEQSGVIRVFANDPEAQSSGVFLDIDSRVTSGGELGLLGLAFHPDYENNGFFYVNYTTGSGGNRRTIIARYSVSPGDPDRADFNSESVILTFAQPFSNHNGGMIEFGNDGYLYIAAGDGGSGGDPFDAGQDLGSLLGAILRIDIDNPESGLNYGIPQDNPFADSTDVRREIWAYGLRNPWRFSIDPVSQQLWAGDVGQNRREEIDLIERGGNYGWRIMEGTECFNVNNFNSPLSSCDQTGLISPITDYSHGLGGSVTGGYIYRGQRRPEFDGAYIYGDFTSGRIWLLRYENDQVTHDSLLLSPTNFALSSFGTDESNELYLLEYSSGAIYRFSQNPATSVPDPVLPSRFVLEQNYPNPFNPNTIISYELFQASDLELSIYNALGQKIRTLVRKTQPSGSYEVMWDGTDDAGRQQASGVYMYRLKSGSKTESRKMIFMK